jgi:hypothetical protein
LRRGREERRNGKEREGRGMKGKGKFSKLPPFFKS